MAIKFLSGQTITGDITLSGDITAATFNSLAINSTGTNNVANQIVRTEANGYANFGWINSISGNHTGSITRITASDDQYLRYVTPAQFRTGVTDGFYAPSSTVTGVTSVATGNGLSGGTIISTGTLTMSGSYTGDFNFLGTAVSGAALVTIENNSGSTATSYGLLVKGGGNSSSGKTFEVRDDSGNTDLIVKGNGNVGIGATDPGDVKLFVQNTNTPTTTNPVFETRLETTYNMGISNRWVSQYVSKLKIGRSGTAAEEISSMELIYDIAGAEYGSIKRNYSGSSLKFERSTTTDMIINGSGNVGIGTDLPQGKVDIQYDMDVDTGSITGLTADRFQYGNINFSGVSAQGAEAAGTTMQGITWQVNNYNGSTNYGNQAQLVVGNNGSIGTFMGFFTSGNYSVAPVEAIRIDSAQNVGIGTASPATPLEVAGAITMNPAVAAGTSTYFDWRNNSSTFAYSGSHAAIVSGGGANNYVPGWCTGSNDLIFGTGNTERARILSNGNFLIGTTGTTTTRLKVVQNANSEWACQITNIGTNPYGLAIDTTANTGIFSLAVYTNTGTGMFVRNEGKVGIGTVSPTSKLDISDAVDRVMNASGEGQFEITGNGYTFGIAMGDTTTALYHNSSLRNLSFGTDETERLTILANGDATFKTANCNVGIGTTSLGSISGGCATMTFGSTAAALSGGIMFQANSTSKTGIYWESDNMRYQNIGDFSHTFYKNNSTVLFTIATTGTVTAVGDVVAYSDKKLKKNIKTLDGSKVYKMRGVSFDRIDTGKSSSGVIAQEMQEVAPELIDESKDGTLGVAYGNVTGYLIEAIKELKAEIEELKSNKCNCNK